MGAAPRCVLSRGVLMVGSSKDRIGVLLVQGAAEDRCGRRVSEAVVDRKGLPMRCLRASRPTKGADAEGLFHCTLHLRAFFWFSR